jgi:hypothetical protein
MLANADRFAPADTPITVEAYKERIWPCHRSQ